MFVSHTVTNPQGWRLSDPKSPEQRTPPTLRVVAEDNSGVTINGLKMLGTATAFCHETWCGNLQPVAPGQEKESITCVVPLNAPGVSIWSRKPYEGYAVSEFDNPLASRFDENDAAVLFENVKVPWERVFCHDNVEMTRAIYMRTPGHAMANHQANMRFLEKLKLIIGIASKIADMNGARNVPAVQFTLGRLAAMEATLEGLIMGQINGGEAHPNGYHTVNRRYVYAALHWCTNHHAEICDTVRELMGAGVFQMPADASVLKDESCAKPSRPIGRCRAIGDRPHEASQSRVGPARLGLRRAPHAVREVLRRAGLRDEQLQLRHGAVGRVGRLGGRAAGELSTRRSRCQKNNQAASRRYGAKVPRPRGLVRVRALCHAFAITGTRFRGGRGSEMCKSGQNNTRNMLLATLAVALAALLAPAPAAHAQDKTFTMKLSTATINDTQHEWFKRFAALVEKDSGGRIKAEIYPASQLGAIPRQIEGVQFGSIQAWMGPPEFLVGVDERFEAMSAPGLFSSVDQVMKVAQDPPIQKMMYGLGEPRA